MNKVSIIIPVYNEEVFLAELVKQVHLVDLSSLNLSKEIILINDGSSDKTDEVIKSLSEEFTFISLNHEGNRGKGAAVKIRGRSLYRITACAAAAACRRCRAWRRWRRRPHAQTGGQAEADPGGDACDVGSSTRAAQPDRIVGLGFPIEE